MSTLLKKQIAYTEQMQNASILMKAWLLILHIILGISHVMAMLFLSSSTSFQEVHDLTENGYRVSYLDHCRMQHNVRFGTLAYSLVLVVALTLVRTTVEIVYPDQFGNAAYAANLVVTKAADTNDGVCDADCSLREAINASASNDTITFNNSYTIVLGSTITYPGGRNNVTVDGGANDIIINGNGTVGICLQWTGSGNILRSVTVQNCTGSAVNIGGSTGAILDDVVLAGPAGAANSPLIAGASMELSNSTVSASGARDCINVNGNNVNIHHNTITNCSNGIFTANGTTGTFSNNTIRAASGFAIRVNMNGGGHTISNNTFGAAGGGNQVSGGVFIGSSSTGNTISNNTLGFHSGGNAGIYLSGSQVGSGTNNTVSNNTFTSTSLGTAIRVENSTRNLITANTITDSNQIGIQVQTNANNNTISNNTITSVPTAITVLTNSANVVITGNSITPDASFGNNINLNSVSNATVTGNTVVAGVVGGTNSLIFLNSVTNSNISNNTLSTPTNSDPFTPVQAIFVALNSTGNTISSNVITLNAMGGTGVNIKASNNTVSNNTVQATSSGGTGINIDGASNTKVFGNTVTGIVGTGIGISNISANNTIGLDTVGGGSANTITGIGGNEIMLKGGSVTNTYIRGNAITDNGDGVLVFYTSGAFAATATPAFVTHSVNTISGTAPASSLIDLYGKSGNSYTYLGNTTSDSAGEWSYTNNSLSSYSVIGVSATNSISGTSITIGDTQPTADLVLSDFNIEVDVDSATFTWTTNINSNSGVTLTAPDNTEIFFDQPADDTTDHTVVVTGLEPNTTYTYEAGSSDVKTKYNFDNEVGTFTTASDVIEDTTAPEISDVTISSITANSATITWTTNEAATSRVAYGRTGSYGDSVSDDDLTTNHTITLTDLSAATTYHYRVISRDAADNVTNRDDATFITAADEVVVRENYGDRVSQGAVVADAYNYTTIGGAGSHVSLPSTSSRNLTFTFTDSRNRFTEERMHLVIASARQRQQLVINRKKAFDAQGKVAFKVKQSLLEVEKKYVVSTGIVDADGNYVNRTGLAERFTFTLQDAPQILYPALSINNHVFIGMPEEFVVASKAPSVTVYLDDADGEIFHCTAVMVSGVGSCRPPFYPAGRGEYTLRLVDARGGTVSTPLLLTALAGSDTINLDARSEQFYDRVILGGQPTFVGIAGAENTVEVFVPQIDGPIVADRDGITWSLHLTLTSLPIGETLVTVIERRPDGTIVNNNNYRIFRSSRAVAPAVIAPTDGSTNTVAPEIQIVGPTTGDHILELFNSDGVRLARTNYDNGGRVIDLATWYSQPGTYTVTLMNRNRVNLPSRRVTYTFTIAAAEVVTTTPVVSEPEPTNTNSDTDTNTNTDDNSNTNSNSNSNSEVDSNTNTTTNENTNTVTNTNTNSNGEVVDPDKDGLTTTEETTIYFTDPNNIDTDSDNLADGDEIEFGSDPLTVDADEDGLTDLQEYTLKTDPRDSDSDDDGVLDGTEVAAQTNPLDTDSDDDGLSDNELADYGTLPLDADTDNDRLLDGDEVERVCNPLKADTDGDGIDDLSEALAGTACTSDDNIWQNLTGLEAYLQEMVRSIYASTGQELADYPNLTTQVVAVDSDFREDLNSSIRTATVVDYVAGAETIVSQGDVTVVTRTTELSLFDWLNGEAGTTSDDTFLLVEGQVDLPASLQGQPAYVIITFFSTPTVKIAKVDTNGQWTMTVPAELLSAGEHTAFASVDVNGTQSDQVEVAKFVIEQERQLSNTAWLVIINIVIAIIALLAATFIHLRHKRANESASLTV